MKTNQELSITRVNDVNIVCVEENGVKLIPIRPICDALGIDAKAQRTKIQEDEILSSVGVLSTSTGSDGKQYEMFAIPLEFVFGWLFTINPKNVKPEAQEAVTVYKLQCYRALYEYFAEPQTFLAQKQRQMELYIDEYQERQRNFKDARILMQESKKKLNTVTKLTIEDWRKNGRQLNLTFETALELEEE